MNRQDVTRALIELAVDQGIKNMQADSHRSVRRMADLGKQFARGRFQTEIFSLFQRLLAREDSPYYDMIDRLLANTEIAAVKRFGINAAYNGWTYGASLLRQRKAETGIELPWLLTFSWNPCANGALTLQDISSLITENRKNGTYCYAIRVRESLLDDVSIFRLSEKFPDCVFVLDLSDTDCHFTERQLSEVKNCANLMTLLPCESPGCERLASELLKQKSLFAVSCHYQEENIDGSFAEGLVEKLLSYGSVIICLISGKRCSAESRKKAADFVLNARMEQKFPAILLEWNSDVERVNQIIYHE
ncbi:MAG: hypothetical protein Q4C58_11490 [Eubacteriales bacterium]|nr:hypothetical protein [Eubacteriales bacterium]